MRGRGWRRGQDKRRTSTDPGAPGQGTYGTAGAPARGCSATTQRQGGRRRSRAATCAGPCRRGWCRAVKAPAVSDVTGEGRRPPREQRLVRGARPPVTRVRIVPTREPEQGPREGVLPRARVARHRRQVPARRRSRGALRAGGSNLAGYAFDPEARFRLQPDLTCTFSVGGDGAPPTNYERRSGGTADATAFASTPSGAIG